MAHIIADKRESRVLPFLRTEAAGRAGLSIVEHQINTGDFLLCRAAAGGGVQVVAVFERKTFSDFAGSIRDARYASQMAKMLELRARTGCQLYYLVEGRAFPAPGAPCGHGMKAQSVLTAMASAQLANGIHIVRTKDLEHTALRLCEFAEILMRPAFQPFQYDFVGDPVLPAAGAVAGGLVPAAVTGSYERSDSSLLVQAWRKLPGVSEATAKQLADNWSVFGFLAGPPDLAGWRGPSGKLAPKKVRAGLQKFVAGDLDAHCALLSGLPGLSLNTAAAIFARIAVAGVAPLTALAAAGVAAVADTRLVQKNREIRLGEKRGAEMFRLLNWAAVAAPVAAAAPAAAEPAAAAEDPELAALLALV